MLAGTGVCRAQDDLEMTDQAPADIRAAMRSGGISQRFAQAPIGLERRQALLHVYTVPQSPATKSNGTDMESGTWMHRSRFYLDLFLREKGRLKRLNTVSFEEEGQVNGSLLRWLEPKNHRGPVLLLRFSGMDGGAWHLFAFPEGVERAVVQKTFIFGGDRESSVAQEFDAMDSHGRMMVVEEWTEGNKKGVDRYTWDGVEFADRTRPYFVIAASMKTHAEAEAFVQHHKDMGDCEIRPSDHYARLTPGYFIVIACRFEKLAEAQDFVKDLPKGGTDCYVKRAF